MSRDRRTARGMSRFAFFASSPIAVTDSKPTRIRIAIHAWMITYENACGLTTDFASVWYWNDVIVCFGFAGSGAVDIAESAAYVIVNGLSVPSAFFSTT